MRQVVSISETGGPEVMTVKSEPVPEPGAGEVLVATAAIGLNFVDVYHRSGMYPIPLPNILGVEGAGEVIAVADDVTSLKPGDRVVFAGIPLGAYASHRVFPADRAIKLPDGVSYETGAAAFIKGLTVDMVFNKVFSVKPETTMLIHGAAGGLGTLMTKWAKHIGARVIGAVGSEQKAAAAYDNGADEVIVGRDADFAAEIAGMTDGGVDVVYDGVGGATLLKSLQCVRPFGTVVSLGQAAGRIEPVSVDAIGAKAASLSRPSIIAYTMNLGNYTTAADRVLKMVEQGVTPTIGAKFDLSDIVHAHNELEAGRTKGSSLLIPNP